MKDLLKEILNCENIKDCLEGNKSNPCFKVVNVQKESPNFLLPEPWNGDIVNAKIMFISSNPSIDENEEFPTSNWDEDSSYDFFVNRFSGSKQKWVKDNKYVMLKNGEYRNTNVKFWASIGARCKEIYNREIIYGSDFSITEIVKCKSKSEIGVKEAMKECTEKYFLKMMAISRADIIIILGSLAKKEMARYYNLDENIKYIDHIQIEGKDRTLVFLPHPNSREKNKTIEKVLGNKTLLDIQNKIVLK